MERALILATLDPKVRAIDYVRSTEIAGRQVIVDAVVVVRDEGFFHLDVEADRARHEASRSRDRQMALEHMVLPAWTVTSGYLAMPPLVPNALECWRHRFVRVEMRTRLQILQILEDSGSIAFARLLESVHSNVDVAAAVLSCACADLVEIDLHSRPVGPQTAICVRRQPR